VTSPEQEAYELVRPILLFGQLLAERARETGVSESTLRRKAARIATQGLLGLFAQEPSPTHDQRRLPPEIREAIVALKAEYPPFSLHEIAAICRASFGRPVDHQTVGRVLAAEPLPLSPPRRVSRYHEIPDPVQRRKAIVDLYHDGWSPRAIAGYLATSRARVHDALKRWDEEGWPGLADRSRAPHHPARKVDLKAMAAIRRLQENPELGEFRVHAALAQLGIHLSPRTCGTILALHRALGAPHPSASAPREPRPMPFAAARWHQWWSVDVRYIEDSPKLVEVEAERRIGIEGEGMAWHDAISRITKGARGVVAVRQRQDVSLQVRQSASHHALLARSKRFIGRPRPVPPSRRRSTTRPPSLSTRRDRCPVDAETSR
jgi:transposase